jgi:GntR family transcriptional regulator, transcriptional repressor for pyruvate dehydrogenase complex
VPDHALRALKGVGYNWLDHWTNGPTSVFSPIRRRKIADQVAESIRDAILGGSLDTGEKLPSERALAERFGVNRTTVREAVQRLEAWGLVEVRQGGATRVTDFLTTAGMQLLPFLIAPSGSLDVGLIADLLDLRVALLGFTAARAARGAPDVAELQEVLTRLEDAGSAIQRQELDYDFFEVLVRLSDNRVLGLLANAIRRVYAENGELFTALYALPLDTTPHRQVVKALREGDEEAARVAMESYGRVALGVFS